MNADQLTDTKLVLRCSISDKWDFDRHQVAYVREIGALQTYSGLIYDVLQYIRDMDRTYAKMLTEDEGTKPFHMILAVRLICRSGPIIMRDYVNIGFNEVTMEI